VVNTPELEGKARQPVTHRADTEHHHVHHHGVGHVFIAGEPRFHQGKAGLHKEHQEARDQHPHRIQIQRDRLGRRSAILGKDRVS
jgi:hypothetical protein